jgi:hypothetical protein
MTATERAQILVAARLLRATSKLDQLSIWLTLFTALALLTSTGPPVLEIVVVALGALARWYALRIDFDARLLEDVAADTFTKEDLDEAFVTMSLASRDKLGRDWSARWRGVRGLVTVQAALFAVQVVAFLSIVIMIKR